MCIYFSRNDNHPHHFCGGYFLPFECQFFALNKGECINKLRL